MPVVITHQWCLLCVSGCLDLEDNILGLGVVELAVEGDELVLEGTEGNLVLLGVAQVLVPLLQLFRTF